MTLLKTPASELAVGSIDASGWTYIARHAREAGVDEAYLAREKQKSPGALEEVARLASGWFIRHLRQACRMVCSHRL